MVETTAFRTLKSLASRYPVVLVCGPRGTRASALARRLMPAKSYLDLSDERTFSLAKQSPKTFLLAFPDGAIIDSLERLPSMVEAMRYHIGRWGFTPGKFIGISTCAFDLDESDGRLVELDVAGLTVDDLQALKTAVNHPFQTMLSGQLPDVVEGRMRPGDVVDEILERDVLKYINKSNLESFRAFMCHCASASTEDFSARMIAKVTGISAPTAKTWLSILERHSIIRTLFRRNDENCRAFFFSDTGILCNLLGIETKEDLILSPHRELVARTFAMNELLRGRFSKSMDADLHLGLGLDFLANWNGGFGIVIDPNIEVTEGSMAKALSSESRTVILHLGDVTYTKDGIDCISYRDWAKLAMEIDYFS